MEQLKRPRRFLLVTHPRSASNLLGRVLNLGLQKDVLARPQPSYFFMPMIFLCLDIKPVTTYTTEETLKARTLHQKCGDELSDYVNKAAALDKIAFAKEHGFLFREIGNGSKIVHHDDPEHDWVVRMSDASARDTDVVGESLRSPLNITALPDEFLETWQPLFLVRHPALSFPSFFRCSRDSYLCVGKELDRAEFGYYMSLHWSKAYYDWYVDRYGPERDTTWPIVIDADQVMAQPAVLVRLCELTGLDPEALQFQWHKATPEETSKIVNPQIRRYLSTLLESTSVQQDKMATNLSIAAEFEKWKQEFGIDDEQLILKFVEAAMPDYEFLTSKRLTV